MADSTTPVTPVIPAAQDLQINLADVNEQSEGIPQGGTPKIETPELNLDLDLNLSDAPKDDDRLKTEDQKNNEVVATPTEVIARDEAIQNQKTIVEPAIEVKTEMPIAAEPTLLETTPEAVAEITQLETPVEPTENSLDRGRNEEGVVAQAPVTSQPVEQKAEVQAPTEEVVSTPSTTIESEPITAAAPAELQEDMKMIDELEGHTSAGGLAPEAVIVPQPTPAEAPKTFDLDAMLGGPATPPTTEQKVTEQSEGIPQGGTEISMPQPMPAATAAPIQAPAFTIPTATTQVPVQAVMQTSIPQNKNKWVKALLFTVMFAALGFTTFFILKTMYPVEFGSMFGGSTIQTHALDNTTGTVEELTGTVEETTGAVEELSGIIETGTGTHESAIDNAFADLNELGIETTPPEQTDVSRLTDYVTQGNDFLTQGKMVSNNTMIKYGLYISKKAATFLEKIANGEEINNLSGYFAQFDQYIVQLKELAGQTIPSDVAEIISTTPPTNDLQMTPDSTPQGGATTNTWF